MNRQPIGFMDSGVGGLTAVVEAMRQLPNESMVFLGDQARMPYGPRTPEEVQQFSLQIARFLETKAIKLLVIACNTATAAALPTLQQTLTIPVVGVIEAGSKQAVELTRSGEIGVIATEGTVKSGAYAKAIRELDQTIHVTGLACPQFVTAVEHNAYKSAETRQLVKEQLSYFNDHPVDTLIMGCTHFPLLKNFIAEAMGDPVTLVDSGAETINTVKQILTEMDLLNDGATTPTRDFYTTGEPLAFATIARDWLEDDTITAEKVSVETLEGFNEDDSI